VKAWTTREDALLGKRPDREVARLIGRTRAAVKARRLKLANGKAG